MAWSSSTTRRLKVLISGKTLKSPDRKLTSGLNLSPKVSRTKHVVAGIFFFLFKRKRASPAFQMARRSWARCSPVWTGSGAASVRVSQLTCLGITAITKLLCPIVKVNCLSAEHISRGMLIIFISFKGSVKRLGRELSCSEGQGNK